VSEFLVLRTIAGSESVFSPTDGRAGQRRPSLYATTAGPSTQLVRRSRIGYTCREAACIVDSSVRKLEPPPLILHRLERYFDIIVLDLGTGLLDDTTKYILEKVCDQLVVVAPAELDGAELGAFTLEFVADGRGVAWVRERAVVVINRVVKDTQVDVSGMELYFRQWVRACLRISQDPHLKTGGVFDWSQISRAADEQILALTAEIARGFSLGRAVPGGAVE
jgi:MinD-like ATPase involved in chromosome partitioning or flagellar assembly